MLENLSVKRFNEWVDKNNWLEIGKKHWEELVDIRNSSIAASDLVFPKDIDEVIYLLPDGRTANVCFKDEAVISIRIPSRIQDNSVRFRGLL